MKAIIERYALFILLLFSTGAGVGILIAHDAAAASSSSGEPVIQLAFGLMYVFFFVFVAVRFREAFFLIYEEKWIALLCVWCLASVAWSVDPGETFRRSLALIATSMVGLYIGMRYEPKQLLRITALCLAIGAIASLAVGFVFPGIGVTQEGAWQGVFFLKNTLGRMMSLGVLCFAFIAIGQRRYRTISIGMILVCATLLVLAKSVTGIVVSLSLLALLASRGVFTWPARRLVGIVVLFAVVAFPLAIWSYENHDEILQALGRESSLTGRLPLWHYVKQDILNRPALGYGFSAFWTSSESARIQADVAWDAPNAHNGFLETLLGVGIIGFTILAFGLTANFVRSFRAVRVRDDADQYWPLFFLFFIVLYSLTESSMLVVNSVLWLLYTANSYWLVRARLQPETAGGEERASPEEGAYSRVLQSGPVVS